MYPDVALRYITHTKKISILRLSGLGDHGSGIPTWVPDWRVRKKQFSNMEMLASGGTVSKVQFRGPGILNVTGMCLAIVQQNESLRGKTDEKVIANIRKSAPDDILESSYVGGGSLLSAYCHTICGSNYAEMYMPHRKAWPRVQQSLDFLFAISPAGRRSSSKV